MAKRPTSTDSEPITNEWGIYDPAKAGMQALYAKLGRPVLRASSKKTRQERRRAFRVERPNDGVGLAIEEAMQRASLMQAQAAGTDTPPPVPAPVPVSPARAVRIALKVAKPPQAPFVPADIAPSAKKKATRRARTEAAPPEATVPAVAAPAAAVAPAPAVKTRAARKPAKARAKTAAAAPAPAAEPTAPAAVAAPVQIAPPAPPAPPSPPAPSPRRPRGPVPLAAWARAVTDLPRTEPRRADKRGFWKALFRMPAEVALVEYARGCRIHRLLIETSDDEPLLDLL